MDFSSLPDVPLDEVFKLLAQYNTDTHPDKANLGAGVYCSDEGEPCPLQVVGDVEKSMIAKMDITRHNYNPIEGDRAFLQAARNLVFESVVSCSRPTTQQHRNNARIASVQAVAGTGANHLGARFLAEHMCPRSVWISDPTWDNHIAIWSSVGVAIRTYPYYDPSKCTFNYHAMMDTLEREAQPGDVIVLHACAHNPTGSDPTRDQWVEIADLCHRKKLYPFFDNAYQGFASGDPDQDAWAMRYFYNYEPPMQMCVAQSFSKNFGLYGQRLGAFHLVLDRPAKHVNECVIRNFCQIIRSEYSVPPRYGSTIVKNILQSEKLTKRWLTELRAISDRMRLMRLALYEELGRLGTPGSWEHIIEHVSDLLYHKRQAHFNFRHRLACSPTQVSRKPRSKLYGKNFTSICFLLVGLRLREVSCDLTPKPNYYS